MNGAVEFLVRHGEAVVFAVVLAEQIGLPVPAVPVLLAAGALAGAGKISLASAILLSLVACFAGDLVWYELGRYRGRQALNLLCRISLEPDSCVRRTENFFGRHGLRSLVLAKFIPGLSTITPALAGLFGVSARQFLLYNGLGSLVWSVSFIVPGYLFSHQLEAMVEQIARFGAATALLLGGSFTAYVAYKFIHRQWVLRGLRIARISPDELKGLMDDGRDVVVVDLRGAIDHKADPHTIPGALRITAEELEHRHQEIPRDQEVILFCACPNEVTAARMALMLRKHGITRVRPLAGGGLTGGARVNIRWKPAGRRVAAWRLNRDAATGLLLCAVTREGRAHMTDSKGGIEMKMLIIGNGCRSGTKPRWIGSMPPFFLKVVATW